MTRFLLCTVVTVLLLPGTAVAINLFSMQDLPVRHMTDEDREILKAAVADALERTRDGDSARWANPKTGAHGDLTPRASYQSDGLACRDLEVANSARGRSNRLTITLCKQSDGEWKINNR
jgi:surface antigen